MRARNRGGENQRAADVVDSEAKKKMTEGGVGNICSRQESDESQEEIRRRKSSVHQGSASGNG